MVLGVRCVGGLSGGVEVVLGVRCGGGLSGELSEI